MDFSEKLQKLRKENKLSQEQLANLLDVFRQAVSKWESGATYPEMDKLLAMCKIFHCTLEELTNDEIKEINKEKKANLNIIDELLEAINKTINMFHDMTSQEIILLKQKCLQYNLRSALQSRLCARYPHKQRPQRNGCLLRRHQNDQASTAWE